MRGAVSVALVYHFFDFSDESEHVASIIAMTIIVVVFSTMVFGAVTKPLLDLMLGKGQHLSDCCLLLHPDLLASCGALLSIMCILHSASARTLQLLAA